MSVPSYFTATYPPAYTHFDPAPPKWRTSGDEAATRNKKVRRTCLTQNACTRCRVKKTKCDGKREVCGRCERDGTECNYDIAQEGVTKMQDYQQRLESKTEELTHIRRILRVLRQGSDQQAAELLARLRIDEEYDGLVDQVIKQLDDNESSPADCETQSEASYTSSRHSNAAEKAVFECRGVEQSSESQMRAPPPPGIPHFHDMMTEHGPTPYNAMPHGPPGMTGPSYVPQRSDHSSMAPGYAFAHQSWG